MSKYTHHIIIALLIGVLVGIVIARWLDAHTEPEPRGPKPPKGRFYTEGEDTTNPEWWREGTA